MPADLDAAIRKHVQKIRKHARSRAIEAGEDHDKPLYRAAVDAETVVAALLAVLDLHEPDGDGRCSHCLDGDAISISWGLPVCEPQRDPCATKRAIAKKLGIAVPDE